MNVCPFCLQWCGGMYEEGVSWRPKCAALVPSVVCKSVTWGSWGFVTQWVAVSEWDRCHGWLMNDVFSSPSHHRDIDCPPQVSEGCTGVWGFRSGEFRGALLSRPFLTTRRSVRCTERCSVELVKALRSALWGLWGLLRALHWGCCHDVIDAGLGATHSEKSEMHRIIHAARNSREECMLLDCRVHLRCHDVQHL